MTQALGRILRETEQALADPANASPHYLVGRAGTDVHDLRRVQDFFEIARIQLSTAIFNREPPQSMGIQVGTKSRSSPPQNAHIESLLGLQVIEPNTQLAASKPYGHIWAEFKSWANSKGLRAVWIQEEDGISDFTWHVLTLRPAT